MTTPPRPSDTDLAAALTRIRGRHPDRPDLHLLDGDPRDALRFLRRLGHGGLRPGDVPDGLTVRFWLWWEGEAAEVWLLNAADTRAEPWRPVAAALGIDTRQGVDDRRKRKRGMLDRTARHAPAPALPPLTVAEARGLVAALLREHRRRLPEDVVDDLDALLAAVRSPAAVAAEVAAAVEGVRAAGLEGPAREAVEAVGDALNRGVAPYDAVG